MSAAAPGMTSLTDRNGPVLERLPRVLFLGENWYGSCARACCAALRRFGCEVIDIDVQTFFPTLSRRSSRAIIRLFSRRLIAEYNERIIETAKVFRPEVLMSFSGVYVRAETLCALRKAGIRLYNYFPDASPLGYTPELAESIFEYDCVFYTKHYWRVQLWMRKLRASAFVPHGYDAEIHQAQALDARTRTEYENDVTVVATWSPHKEQILDRLVAEMPSIDLRIWGNSWNERSSSTRVRKFLAGAGVQGSSYVRIVSAARINLAIMMGRLLRGVSQTDETTTRTYEIPACGGFMLHERTPELQTLFEENKEVACFGSVEEAAEKIRYYLAHPEQRESIARAGHARCVPAYSYDNRMIEILNWHARQCPR